MMKIIIKYLDDLLLIMGLAFLIYGAFMIYIPVGYITTGICLIAAAFLVARKKVGDGDR